MFVLLWSLSPHRSLHQLNIFLFFFKRRKQNKQTKTKMFKWLGKILHVPLSYTAREMCCKLVWPSGKAVRLVSIRASVRFCFGLLSLQNGCGLWTQSCDFVPHN